MINRVFARLPQLNVSSVLRLSRTMSQQTTASATVPEDSVKRAAESSLKDDETAKKPKLMEAKEAPKMGEEGYLPFKKKKVAMLMVYSGKGYLGMQLQSGTSAGLKTIERDLLEALVKAGVVLREQTTHPGSSIHFQRAARTDKGVSAAGQVVSLKMNVENAVEKINSNLPSQIRVLDVKRATKGFDSKNTCCGRTYMYLLPTFTFAPVEQPVTEQFRAPDDLVSRTNEVLSMFKGTRNFHNFTSGKKPSDPSARRYIIDFHMEEPFVRDDLEWAVIKVKGQSFMLHQIRKMIGLTIAIVRGLTDTDAVKRAYGPDKCDIPKAPGLGLMLDRVHYDHYNNRFGKDGIHEAIDWDQYKEPIEKFKEEFIYSSIVETEKQEKSMLSWMSTLHLHHFGNKTDEQNKSGIGMAKKHLVETQKATAAAAAAESNDVSREMPSCSTEEKDASTSEEVSKDSEHDKSTTEVSEGATQTENDSEVTTSKTVEGNG